jgi:hypothetical protein
MAMKSASDSSRVHLGAVPAPAVTEPGGDARSIVHTLSGPLSLNWKTVFTFSATSALAFTNPSIARKMSAEIGSALGAAPPPVAALGLAAGLGISFHSSMAALEMTTSLRSLTLVWKTIF